MCSPEKNFEVAEHLPTWSNHKETGGQFSTFYHNVQILRDNNPKTLQVMTTIFYTEKASNPNM